MNAFARTLMSGVFAGALLAGGLAGAAAAKTIKIAHEEPADADRSAAHISALVFKDVIESRSNGDMTVEIHAASDLGNQRERMELTKADIIQVNIASIGGLAGFYPTINAIDLPFALPDVTTAYEVFDGPFGDKLAADMEAETGLRLLGVNAGGFYVLTNSERPVRTPEDMKGIKFRTMSVPSHIAMMESLGAAATPVPWDELYSALQTGVVEGQHNPIPIMAIGNLQEVQKYASLTNHMFGADWWVTSAAFHDGLSDAERVIFDDAVAAAKLAGRGAKLSLQATEFGVGFLKDAGMEVYSPTEEELAQFRDRAVPAVMKTVEADLGAEGVALAEDLLAAVKAARGGPAAN